MDPTGRASYNKPRLSTNNYETGESVVTTSCDSYLVPTINAFAQINDYGASPLATLHTNFNSASSSGHGPADAQIIQSVPLYTFPYDWHGYGGEL